MFGNASPFGINDTPPPDYCKGRFCILTPMKPDFEAFHQWENNFLRSQPLNVEEHCRLFDAMYRPAIAAGIWPPKDPLEGFEEKLAFIRQLHGIRKAASSADAGI